MMGVAILGLSLFASVLIKEVTAQPNNNLQASIEALQQEKLQLEIKELRVKSNLTTQVTQSIPFITTLVAVSGLIFGMYQNRIARRNELMLRDEEHLRSDMDQLLTLQVDKQSSVGKISFLFDDLNQLINRRPDRRKPISDAIIRFIKEDCDFDNLRHVHIDIEAIQNWADYREHLRKASGDQQFIFYKYRQALRRIHDEDPSYFETIEYDSTSGFRVTGYTDELRYLRFLALVRGFSLQLDELNDEEWKLALVQQFKEAVRNPVLTNQLYQPETGPS